MRKKKFEDIEKAYNESLKGKIFVYKSKYGGETFGVVEKVTVISYMIFDRHSAEILERYIKNRSSEILPFDATEKARFIAHRPIVRITSTNGISYDLDEIGIISKMKKSDGKN